MPMFAPVLGTAVLESPPEVGASINVQAPASTASSAIPPSSGAGASILVTAQADSRVDVWSPVVAAGVHIELSTLIDTATVANAPIVATSAHVTVGASVETAAESEAPLVTAGVGIALSSAVGTDSAALIPVVVTGVNTQPGTVASTASEHDPQVSAGVAIVLSAEVSTNTQSLPPALSGAGTNVFPIVSRAVARSQSIGSVLEGALFEFAAFEGQDSNYSVTTHLSSFSYSLPPVVATGKNVVLSAPSVAVSAAQAPDIETERRRRMVQAIAA